MRRSRLVATACGLAAVVSFSSWLLAADSRGSLPAGDFTPHKSLDWTLTGPDADALRRDALRRAAVRVPEEVRTRFAVAHESHAPSDMVTCRFLRALPTGTSAKFDCVLEGGEIVKVKYSRNPEIQAEVAATRLVSALGFGADRVDVVPQLRCYGCPRFPFLTMQLLSARFLDQVIGQYGYDDRYTDFTWVALERKFPAPAIETATKSGWAWFELQNSTAPPSEVDALRLLAVFLAHWDNKAENQRLVCLDDLPAEGPGKKSRRAGPFGPASVVGSEKTRPTEDDFFTGSEAGSHDSRQECEHPLALIQDLGATFGPSKVNLARWREFSVWSDRSACRVSMRRLPFEGATFPDVTISEGGRTLLGRQLAALSDADVRDLFDGARFPDYHSATDDSRDLEAWTRAFRFRVDQILTAGPCPA